MWAVCYCARRSHTAPANLSLLDLFVGWERGGNQRNKTTMPAAASVCTSCPREFLHCPKSAPLLYSLFAAENQNISETERANIKCKRRAAREEFGSGGRNQSYQKYFWTPSIAPAVVENYSARVFIYCEECVGLSPFLGCQIQIRSFNLITEKNLAI